MSTPLGLRSFKAGVPPSALTAGCGSGDLTLAIETIVTANWPPISIGPFVATIDRGEATEEQVLVTGATTSQFTVERGVGPTGAQAHAIGAEIVHTNDAPSMQDVAQHVYDSTRYDHTQYPLLNLGLAGHPTSGTWAVNNVVIDSNGSTWKCTVSGTPGTWVQLVNSTTSILQAVYPVGCVHIETTGVNPATTFGFGTWAAFAAGRVLVGVGTSDEAFTAGATGGESTHLLTSAESGLVDHSHVITGTNVGSPVAGNPAVGDGTPQSNMNTDNSGAANASSAHNNLQPYVVVYMWHRTA